MKKQVLSRGDFARVVGEYLNVVIPEGKHPAGSSEVIFLDDQDMGNILFEGPKQKFVHRAVYDITNSMIFAAFDVTLEHCEDHFPDHPTIPMGRLGQVMAQVGASLVFLENAETENFNGNTEAVESGGRNIVFVNSVQSIDSFAATIDGRKKIFMVPGDHLLIVAERGKEKIATKASFVGVYFQCGLMATMEVVFEMLPWNTFSKLYRRQNF